MFSARRTLERLRVRPGRGPRGAPGEPVECALLVDGQAVRALSGQSVAAALIGAGIWRFRRHPISGEPRGPYCGMGVCFECELAIDGATRRACLVEARAGMVIATGAGPEDTA